MRIELFSSLFRERKNGACAVTLTADFSGDSKTYELNYAKIKITHGDCYGCRIRVSRQFDR